jgi:hypothetical protein
MILESKFNIGEKVFTIDRESLKVREFEVYSIAAKVSKDDESPEIEYHAKGDSFLCDNIPERLCFASREELMKHIG